MTANKTENDSIFKNYDNVSIDIKAQIHKLVDIWKYSLDSSLIGVYLQGSMVLDCFAEGVSDIDLLIVCSSRISREKRLELAKRIMEIDKKPASLEMSAIRYDDLNPWRHPVPCQFHYSDYWTERYMKMLSGEIKNNFIIDEDFTDADIACHAKLTSQSGICLYGKPIKEVFPEVPEDDFLQSITADVDDNYSFTAYGQKYYTSQILNLGRVLSYKVEKRILSKYAAGLWIIDRLPEKLRYIVKNALKSRYFGEAELLYKPEDLELLRQFLINEINKKTEV